MSDLDVGEEEDRGYEDDLNFNDTFLTSWTLIWMYGDAPLSPAWHFPMLLSF